VGAKSIIVAGMNPCLKKVLFAFGAILLTVVLFVPYRSVTVMETREPGSILVKRITTPGQGFMFLPRFLRAARSSSPSRSAVRGFYRLDARLYAGEILAVLALASLDYFLLCPRGRRRAPGQGF
jgi:hypothetical protein